MRGSKQTGYRELYTAALYDQTCSRSLARRHSVRGIRDCEALNRPGCQPTSAGFVSNGRKSGFVQVRIPWWRFA